MSSIVAPVEDRRSFGIGFLVVVQLIIAEPPDVWFHVGAAAED